MVAPQLGHVILQTAIDDLTRPVLTERESIRGEAFRRQSQHGCVMIIVRAIRSTVIGAALVGIVGCSSADPPDQNVQPTGTTEPLTQGTGGSAPATTAAINGRVLMSVDVEPGHRVEFREFPGGRAISEVGLLSHVSRLDASVQSFAVAYALLHPGADVPAALLESDRRAAAAAAVPNPHARDAHTTSPAATQMTVGAGPTFYTAGEQQWFASTFCSSCTPSGSTCACPQKHLRPGVTGPRL